MNNKIVSIITRAGVVIITTLASFVISPPVIDAEYHQAINWKNIFIFCAGVLSILLFDKFKQQPKFKSFAYWLVASLIVLITSYEILYNKFSLECFNSVRSVVPHALVKNEVKESYNFWKHSSQDPIKSLLESHRCSSIEIWNMSDLIFPYYGMIVFYFLMIINLTILLVLISDVIQSHQIHPS